MNIWRETLARVSVSEQGTVRKKWTSPPNHIRNKRQSDLTIHRFPQNVIIWQHCRNGNPANHTDIHIFRLREILPLDASSHLPASELMQQTAEQALGCYWCWNNVHCWNATNIEDMNVPQHHGYWWRHLGESRCLEEITWSKWLHLLGLVINAGKLNHDVVKRDIIAYQGNLTKFPTGYF